MAKAKKNQLKIVLQFNGEHGDGFWPQMYYNGCASPNPIWRAERLTLKEVLDNAGWLAKQPDGTSAIINISRIGIMANAKNCLECANLMASWADDDIAKVTIMMILGQEPLLA